MKNWKYFKNFSILQQEMHKELRIKDDCYRVIVKQKTFPISMFVRVVY